MSHMCEDMTMAIPHSGLVQDDQPISLRIERARRGERAAQNELLRELQDVWFRYCMSQLRDEHLARDATQETALRFLRGLAGFRGDSQLKTWSLGIALNVCRETMRRRGREIDPHDYQAMRDGAADDAGLIDEHARLRDMVDELPPRQREAVVLRFFESLSVQETAGVMQCAAGTVKATVSQALRSMRKRWSESS